MTRGQELQINVAAFFVYSVLGSDYHGGYGKAGEAVVQLAMTGIRLVIDDFRTDVTRTKKDGSRGALRISYGEPHKPDDAIAWMWKFIVCRVVGYAGMCWRRPVAWN
jgi:hypothetical protein